MRRHRLLHLLAVNGLAGTLAGVVAAAGLLLLNVGGLGTLVAGAEEPILPAAMMTFGFVVTLASVAMGTAIMRIGQDEEHHQSGRLVPIRVETDEELARRRRLR